MFDEMSGTGGAVRAPYEQIGRWIERSGIELLQKRALEAEAIFRRIGITFAVYGEGGDPERLIPFDLIPRVFSAAEWRVLDRGIRQRARALNAFLYDVYHRGEILKAGIVPERLVYQNAAFVPAMVDVEPPGRVYSHIVGIDIVRTGEGSFQVLEDNCRTPSGVSYMLENREIMMRMFPELFGGGAVEPVDLYPAWLLRTLEEVAPPACGAEPTVVLLTPGAFNSAYYEHSFLADLMGIELVEAGDLFVDEARVWMRTTRGPRKVDVIYRRIDDEFIDPLAFRPELAARHPGALRRLPRRRRDAGLGAGRRRRGRQVDLCLRARHDPLLPGRGADLGERADLALLEPGRVRACARPPRRGGGQGGARLGRLRHADRAEGDRGRAREVRRAHPRQPGRVHRPADARPLDRAVARGERAGSAPCRPAPLLPGRPADAAGAGRADAGGAEGGFAGRQFVPGWRGQGHMGAERIDDRTLLSRTAENLYWLGRYVERADSTARLIEMGHRMAMLPGSFTRNEWRSVAAASGCLDRFEDEASITEAAIVRTLMLDNENPSSIRACLERARANGRSVRTALTVPVWEALNDGWRRLELMDPGNAQRDLPAVLDWVKSRSALIRGAAQGTMLRNGGYHFLTLGGLIERADMTLRLLDVKSYVLLPETEVVGGGRDHHQWTSVLHATSALRAYHHVYRGDYSPQTIADFLILNRQFPRSAAFCYAEIAQALDALSQGYGEAHDCQRTAAKMVEDLGRLRMGEIFRIGLHEFVLEAIGRTHRLGTEIYRAYFS